MEQLARDGSASNFVELVYSSGLNSSFEVEDGPLTLFVPIDEAFTKLPKELVANFSSDPDLVKRLLLSHLVPGQKLEISSLDQEDLLLKNALGANVRVNVYLKSKFYEVSRACSLVM